MKMIKIPLIVASIALGLIYYTNCSKPRRGDADTPAVAAVPPAHLDDAPVSFHCGENTFTSDMFSVGSVNTQNGWQAEGPYDQEVVSLSVAESCRGNGAWRISSKVSSGAFGDQSRSPELLLAAGETGIGSPGGGDSMYFEFFFKAKSNSGDDSMMDVSHASSPAIDRHDLIRIANYSNASGFQVIVRDADPAGNLVAYTAASGLDRNVWHHIKAVFTSPDGPSNDILKIYLDGTLVGTYTTWEQYMRVGGGGGTPRSGRRVLFRIPNLSAAGAPPNNTPAIPSASSQGFYIDDLQQVTFSSAAPTVIINEYRTGFEN